MKNFKQTIKLVILIAAVIFAGLFVNNHVNYDFTVEKEIQQLKSSNKENTFKLSKLEKISSDISKENEALILKNTKLHRVLHSKKSRLISYLVVNAILPRVYVDINKTKSRYPSLGEEDCKKILLYQQRTSRFIETKFRSNYFNIEEYEFLMNVIIHEVTTIQRECNRILKGTI